MIIGKRRFGAQAQREIGTRDCTADIDQPVLAQRTLSIGSRRSLMNAETWAGKGVVHMLDAPIFPNGPIQPSGTDGLTMISGFIDGKV